LNLFSFPPTQKDFKAFPYIKRVERMKLKILLSNINESESILTFGPETQSEEKNARLVNSSKYKKLFRFKERN
jgi:hypothetical protein